MEVPLWLAVQMQQILFVALLPPRQFSPRVRADLAADADAVNLRDLAPYWYDFGAKVAAAVGGAFCGATVRMMRSALGGRLAFIARSVYTRGAAGASDPHKTIFGVAQSTAILDHAEAAIYEATVGAQRDAEGFNWDPAGCTLKPLEIYSDLY